MPVVVDRATLALDLRTYGEDELADRAATIDDHELTRIHDRADDYLPEANGLLAKAVTLAAIEVLEGTAREPHWKRRKLKAIYPDESMEPERTSGEPVDRREVDRALAAALNKAGYHKSAGVFVKQLTKDVNGRVGFFTQRLGTGELEVTPTIGVRHERMHEFIDHLEGRKGSRTEPTVTIGLGYLLPQSDPSLVWRFDPETPPDEVAQSIAEHIEQYGEPWMHELIPFDAIVEAVRADVSVHPERLPVALWLAGRPDEAREALDAELRKAEGRDDAAAENFRRFAERFHAQASA